MKRFILLLPILLLVITESVLQADVIHVPSQQPTIQAGIDAAVDGDTVLVADGTYTGTGNRDIDFLGKKIVVISENGADGCIIDCDGSISNPHRGFYFHTMENENSVLSGFTILNGYTSNYGGGIYCFNCSPTIKYNRITGNTTTGKGGGVYCSWDYIPSATLRGNIIEENSAWDGGGISCDNYSRAVLEGNTIRNNTADDDGGGIYCDYFADPDINGNMIVGNVSDKGGGGVFITNGASTDLTYNIIKRNIANTGAGIFTYSYDSQVRSYSNTITANSARNNSGGFRGVYSGLIAYNTILWGNIAPEDPELSFYYMNLIDIRYSDIGGSWPGEGNIDEDPMFVQPDTMTYTDYRLLWGSPCIDAGHLDSLDADGTRSDMGGHYFNQNDFLTLYLTPDKLEVAQGSNLGVTYTAINRWHQPKPFWVRSRVFRPGGSAITVLGPDSYTLPADSTAQEHITHPVPNNAPAGMYEYRSLIGMPPGTLYDEDSFKFKVVE